MYLSDAGSDAGRKAQRRRFDDEDDDRAPSSSRSGTRQVRTGVSATEIWSGGPLNELLDELTGLRDRNSSALDPTLLERINVAPRRGSSLGLLKNKGVVEWPLVFRGTTFKTERTRMTAFAQEAVEQARSGGRVDPAMLTEMGRTAQDLEAKLKKALQNLPPSDYIEAKRFLKQLDDALGALGQPDVASYFDHTYEARGRTVAQLVRQMNSQNLRFAPATPGSEQAYLKLYRALLASADRIQGDATEE
jgi:hypothetical protein